MLTVIRTGARRAGRRSLATVAGLVLGLGLLVGTAGSAQASCTVWYFDVADIPAGALYTVLVFDEGWGDPVTVYEVVVPGDDVFCGT